MLQEEYTKAILSFGKHLSETADSHAFCVAPGDSATYMVKTMEELGISLPTILLLDHDESWSLSTRTRSAVEDLMRQHQGDKKLTRLHIIDDFAHTGIKHKRIHEVTQIKMGIPTQVSVLVAHTNATSLPNETYVHTRDDNMANWLRDKWHRR